MKLTARSRPERWLEALDDADDALVQRALGHKSGLVVARAAKLGPQHHELLVGGFERLLVAGAVRDPGCSGKVAVLEALGEEAPQELLERAAVYRQPEKSWGPPVDTAGGVRARAVLTMVDRRELDAPMYLGLLLADASVSCRRAGYEGLAAWGDEVLAGALIRMRVELGEDEPDALGAAFDSLLELSPDLHGPYVVGCLKRKAVVAECAALSLGAARLDVLGDLVGFYRSAKENQTAATALVAIGLLRSEPSIEALLEVVDDGTLDEAEAALDGLAVHLGDAEVVARVREVLVERGTPELVTTWDRKEA